MDSEEIPKLSDDEDVDFEDDESEDDWTEMEATTEQTTCLFCTRQFRTIAVALDHCRAEHDFDLLFLKNKYQMDCYSFIKMINYIRKHKPGPKALMEALEPIWNDDSYLKPVATETWLMYDFEDLGSTPSTPNNIIDTNKSIPSMSLIELQRTVVNLTNQLKEKDELLSQMRNDMSAMKQITKRLIENTNTTDYSNEKCVANTNLDNDQYYFNSYSHFGIHHEMLSDRVRTESYQSAILDNRPVFEGKEVLDLGCGTGILSMFAARGAGAKRVWGIDQSEIVYKAMDIIRENDLNDTIHLVRGRLEDGMVPFEQVDVIISEWMGYFLLFEGMLDSVIYARDKHLKPKGLLLPNRCNISLVGNGDVEGHKNHITFWNDVYGFKMNCMLNEVVHEASVDLVSDKKLITKPQVLTEIDLTNCTINSVDFTSDFELDVIETGMLTCFVGYFDTFFDLPSPVQFSTGPDAEPTHWKQTVFYLKDPISVREGESICGTFSCRRHVKNVRGLKISIRINDKKYEYTLD